MVEYLEMKRWVFSSGLRLGAAIILVALFSFVFSGVAHAAPATFTVTNTNDSGAGSLRQAVDDANSNGNPADMDVIEFAIAGTAVHTIQLSTELPPLSQKVTVDGYTQPGSSVNTAIAPLPLNTVIKIELTPNGAVPNGLVVTASDVVIRGLSIRGFGDQQITAGNGANNMVIAGNFLQTDATGLLSAPDGSGFGMTDGVNCSGTKVGSALPEDRNIIAAGGPGSGAASIACDDVEVFGNYFNVGKDGITPLSRPLTGIVLGPDYIGQQHNQGARVGGRLSGQANVMANAKAANVTLFTSQNIVQGNYIGSDYLGAPRDNYQKGIGVGVLYSVSENLIGGTNAGDGNVISGLGGAGVAVYQITSVPLNFTLTPNKNAILGNTIRDISVFDYLNLGLANMGIDIGGLVDESNPMDGAPEQFTSVGVTPNDAGDGDTGPNNYLNHPQLKTAVQTDGQLTITYDLDVADSPTDQYRVEFYADEESTVYGSGPGEVYLGAVASESAGSGKSTTLTVNGDYTDKVLTATATAIDGTTVTGFGSTSEFSQNLGIGSAADSDADGISNAVEDAAPNGGDGNGDGTPDRLQSEVTSYAAATGGTYITLVTEGCIENATVVPVTSNSLSKSDSGFSYPYGLTEFELHCSKAVTVNITKYIHDASSSTTGLQLRKFIEPAATYQAVTGAVVTRQAVGASSAIKVAYSVKDGSSLDDDQTENGVIIDPVGLARTSPTIVRVGALYIGLPGLLASLVFLGYVVMDWQRHRRPLVEEDPSVQYTLAHHIRVVTIPLLEYRLSVVVTKK